MKPAPGTIWLAPACGEKDCDNERTWCVDPVNGCDGCDAPPIAYIRADIAAAREARMREALEEVAVIAEAAVGSDALSWAAVASHARAALEAKP